MWEDEAVSNAQEVCFRLPMGFHDTKLEALELFRQNFTGRLPKNKCLDQATAPELL